MKEFRLKSIPHHLQSYDTVGNYQYIGNEIFITVSMMPSDASELAVAIHEVIEAFLCEKAGIPDDVITGFDKEWNAQDALGLALGDEPGYAPDCPYGRQHRAAESVERAAVEALGLTWEDHCRNVEQVHSKQGESNEEHHSDCRIGCSFCRSHGRDAGLPAVAGTDLRG